MKAAYDKVRPMPLATQRLQAVIDGMRTVECRVRGEPIEFDNGVDYLIDALRIRRDRGAACWLVGNGGSGTIADHIACDMVLIGWRAFALTNAALITTMANDFDTQRMFAKQLQLMARDHDALIAMSCSGMSGNIVSALVNVPPMFRVTLSGFERDNAMSALQSDVDFWVPSGDYGVVQVAHLAILHAVIDVARACG